MFPVQGHATMAATESIVESLVFFLNMSCFSLPEGQECFDLKNFKKREIYREVYILFLFDSLFNIPSSA